MSSQTTAKQAVAILLSKKKGFHELQKNEKMNLAVVLAKRGKVIYGEAYDMVKTRKKVDFNDESDIEEKLDSITIYEIKSSNRKDISGDFSKYFFDLTTAELLVAQGLGTSFKFAFVNTLTKDYIELSLNDVFSKAKGIYPKWAIRF